MISFSTFAEASMRLAISELIFSFVRRPAHTDHQQIHAGPLFGSGSIRAWLYSLKGFVILMFLPDVAPAALLLD